MTSYLKFILFFIFALETTMIFASDYHYEKRIIDNHVLHIVTLQTEKYNTQLVKSNNGAIGRETVSAMAKRMQADIAINGGFFEIGGNRDGYPTGTLVIDGEKYKVKNATQALLVINDGKFTIIKSNPKTYAKDNASLISGIPLLIYNGKISPDLNNKKTSFYIKQHARTAIGKTANGDIILVVAEHQYVRNLIAIMLQDETTKRNGTQGLTILELAQLMKDLKCQTALNLDGGGSSTLWIEGKVVNKTVGDLDEKNGYQVARPISDAIVFKHR